MKDIKVKVIRDTSYVYPDKNTLGINGENLQGDIIFELDDFVDGTGYLEVEYDYIHHYEYVSDGTETGEYEIQGLSKKFTMPTIASGNRLLYYPTLDKLYKEASGTLTELAISDGTSTNKLSFTELSKVYYELTKDSDENTYSLPIYNTLLLQEGRLYLQLRINETDTSNPIFKGNRFYLEVLEAINALTSEPPKEYSSWINVIERKLEASNIIAGSNVTITTSGNNVTINSTGGGSGTSDYTQLTNKPQINSVELSGNKSLSDLGINIPTKTSDLTNDSGFITSSYHDSTKQDTITSSTNLSVNTITTAGNVTINGDETNVNGKLFVKSGAVEMTGGTVTIGSTNIGYAQAETLLYRENGSTEPAEYTNIKTAIDTLKNGKQDIIQYITMPTASSAYNDKIVEYIGTSGTYTNGYFYKCGETTVYTPASLNITTSGTSGLGTVTGNADTFGDAVYDNEEDVYTFEYRAYPNNISVVTASDGTKTLLRNRVGDTNGRYAWLTSDNSLVYTETQEPELGTEFFSTATEDSTLFISYDNVTVNEYSDTYGRWQLDYGDDIYEDVDLSEYGISYNGVALIGAKISVQYTDDEEGSNVYVWTQIDVQPDVDISGKQDKTDNTLATTSKTVVGAIGELNTRITNLQNIGRFLAIWNASTGVPTSEPSTSPYTYKTGDYFRIGTIGNKIPTGSSYIVGGTNYTTTTDTLSVGDVYYYDGTNWNRQASSGGGTVQDVQVNSVSILEGGIANIDLSNYRTKPSVVSDSSSTTYSIATLEANKIYKLGTLTSLTITACNSFDEESIIYFTSGSTATTLSLPSDVTKIGDVSVIANKSYIIAIVNKIAVIKEY